MKFARFMKCVAVFAFIFMTTICIGTGAVKAARVGNTSNLQQVNADKTSFTVSWTGAENATAYNIYYKGYASEEDYVLAGNTTQTTYTLTGLTGGMKYYVKVVPTNGTEEGYGSYGYDFITLPDKLTGLKQEKWYYFIKELDVVWDEQTGVDGYEVTLYDNKGKKVSSKISTYERETFKKMKDKVYSVKVRSFVTYHGQKYYSSDATIYCLNQARITKAQVKGAKLTLKWGKIAGATAYEVYVSTKPTKGYKKVATISKKKNSCTIKKFKGKKISSKKQYFVYVKTVCKKGKTKNTSGALYYWNTKDNKYGYL